MAEFAWTEDALAEHLFAVAVAAAAEDGRHLGDDAAHDLRLLVATGAHNLINQPQVDGLVAAIEEAEANLRRLIGMAIDNARTIDGYDAARLGEQTYFPARFRFCPCTPFC